MLLYPTETGKLRESMKNYFFVVVVPFPAFILAKTSTYTLYMPYRTDNVCPSWKSGGVNDFLGVFQQNR